MDNEVKEAAVQFYAALQEIFKGNTAPMENVWSHASDVTYLGPSGGILTGWKDVASIWKEQANKKLGGEVKPQEIHILHQGDIGIVQNFEVGENILNGNTQKVKIRATNIFRKENGKWKMVSHQTDILSFLDN